VYFVHGVHLCSPGSDPLGRGAAPSAAGLRGGGLLPPSSSSCSCGAASLGFGGFCTSHTISATSSVGALIDLLVFSVI